MRKTKFHENQRCLAFGPQNCKTTGAYLGERFAESKEKHPLIGDARGIGMMQAIELVSDRKTKAPDAKAVGVAFEETKKRGVLIGKGGLYGNVIRTGLMLNAGRPEVDEMVEAIDAGLTVAAKVAKEASMSDAKSA